MSVVMRVVVTGTVVAGALALTALPAAAAANPRASCVGTIVSSLASEGMLDVDDFKSLAEQAGTKNFGEFVAGGAKFHEGSLEACLP
jgi:hypothetical protein